MSSIAFLVTELQSLASETRRKHADAREAAEKAIVILKNHTDPVTKLLVEDDIQYEDLLRPVFIGCSTKNPKVTSISLGCLQRLIALKAVPQSAVPDMIKTMNDCMSQGVDIQLRILQTLLSLITNFPAIHGSLLGDALLLCFKMQESRIAVVSSTAAATLRQLVMFIIDKVVDEDKRETLKPNDYTETVLPDGTHKNLGPSALDAYSVVEDLCLLANSEKPHFLKLGALPKTFALELIESVLTNYHDLFRQHNELLVLLQHHLCPLLLKLLSDRPLFPLTLRSTRVVFILLKQFSTELVTEAEVFLALLIKIIGGESDSTSSDAIVRPQWMRVLCMEIVRGLCNDAELMRRIWERYDSQEHGAKLFGSLISVMKRLVTEKPALLGVSSQMFGVGVSSHHVESSSTSGSGSYGFDVGTVAGLVASAASVTMTNVVGMIGTEHGLDVTNSAMKLQCIDQLDKADAPPIPEAYIYMLGLQCLVSISEGFASMTLPVFNVIVVQRSRAAGENTIKAPPALDVFSLPEDQPSTKQLRSVYGMLETGWPGLLAALSFLIATNLSDELFGDVLQSYQNLANVAGMLGLITPRDAFLTSLAKFAIPSRVVSSLETYIEPATPRSSNPIQQGFDALAGTPTQPPGLSERNLACLKVFIASALFLAGSLGEAWYNVLETLQNAEYVLTFKGQKLSSGKRIGSLSSASTVATNRSVSATSLQHSASGMSQPSHVLLTDVDGDNILRSIQRLFDSSKNMDDGAFHDFVSALCKLSAEMVEMQSESGTTVIEVEYTEGLPNLTPSTSSEAAHRRRVSGIHLPKTLRSGDFSINKLGSVSRSNILRFTSRPPDIAWNVVIGHLVFVLRNSYAPHPLRLQAARTLDDILLIVPRNTGTSEDRRKVIQSLMLDALSQQVSPDPVHGNTATVVEIRKMGLETLHQILQSAGHTLVVGWDVVFGMLGSVCDITFILPEQGVSSSVSSRPRPPRLNYSAMMEKGNAVLVRIAFQSLTLVCDTLATLSPEHLRLCISTIGQFGRQADTNIALTAAGSLLWSVSDSIQTRRKESDREEEYTALWMLLLLEVLGLCTDPRSEVRIGAIQTLFRTLQLYGATLSLETWDECLWKIIFPLMESVTSAMRQAYQLPYSLEPQDDSGLSTDVRHAWDESKTLAFQSLSSIFDDFLTNKIINLNSFSRVWDTFVDHIQDSFMHDSATSCTAALRCLEKAIQAASSTPDERQENVEIVWNRSWAACDEMGDLVSKRTRFPAPEGTMGGAVVVFDQNSLLALLDVIKAIRALSRRRQSREWEIRQLTRLLVILKGILTYPDSPSYRTDIDDLTPVQAASLEIISEIDLSVSGSPSLVMYDMSELLTLPFLGAFDVRSVSLDPNRPVRETRSSKRVTYVALMKKVMPLLLETYLRFKDNPDIYTDKTLESVFSSFAVPIKLKYECPAPSNYGNDTPLWKTATTTFLHILKESTKQLRLLIEEIPDVRVAGIWRQIIDVFQGAILADCQSVSSLPIEEQEVEELFDMSLIAALEVDVVPYVADPRVPDDVIVNLARVLHQGSFLYAVDNFEEIACSPSSGGSSEMTAVETIGSTVALQAVPRERFSYWCLDLLFLMCSDVVKDSEHLRRRIAALSLPDLLKRCRMTLLNYSANEALRGNYPFPRAQEEDLIYILKKLLALRLWPGSLWSAFSGAPSKSCDIQHDFPTNLTTSEMLAFCTRRSTRAHLFYLYNYLCQIASLPRTPPVSFAGPLVTDVAKYPGDFNAKVSLVVEDSRNINIEELDARQLASACLAQLGYELGAP